MGDWNILYETLKELIKMPNSSYLERDLVVKSMLNFHKLCSH